MSRKRRPIRSRRVALAIVAPELAYARQKIQGIIDYYAKHCRWEIHRNKNLRPFALHEELLGWDGDGVIGEIYTPEDAANLVSLGIPVVNTSSSDHAPDLPTVRVDNHAIGRLAAEHLVGCKLDNFAFVGPNGVRHARERLDGFSGFLQSAGSKCQSCLYEPKAKRVRHESEEAVDPHFLKDLVAGLHFPVGIMASSDRVGFSVLEACRQLGLRSPEDVALVSVDNDDIYCHLAYSTMTSIRPNAWEVGYQAAAMLDRLMNGMSLEQTSVLIQPRGLVFRHSTDMTRSEYPEVARALRFIRNRASEFIDVTSVLDVVPVSRRWLEMKFKDEIGHGIYQEIRRVHIEHAKGLLETTELPVLRVARESGFTSVERFDFAFQKLVGMSASEYRKKMGKKKPKQSAAQIAY